MATLTTANELLKQVYADAVVEQLENRNMLYKVCEKDFETMPLDGKNIIVSVHKSRNNAVGARAEGGTLPTAGSQAWAQATVPLKSLYATINVSGQLYELAKKGSSAFLDGATAEMDGAMVDFMRDFNRQLHARGDGVICQANGAGSGTATLVLDNQECGATVAQFLEGAKIDIKTTRTGGTLEVNGIVVSAVVSDTATAATVTLASTQTWSDDSFIFRAGNQNNEIVGMNGAVDDGGLIATYMNIDRTAAGNSFWKAADLNNSGTPRNATEALFDDAYNEVVQQGENPTHSITTFPVLKRLGAALVTYKKFDISGSKLPETLPGGYRQIEVNGIPVIADKDCVKGQLYMINAKNFVLYQPFKPEWVDYMGAIWSRTANQDAYDAVLRWYVAFFNKRSNASCVLRDLQ